MEAKLQLQEVREDLAKLDPNNRDHLVEIQRLKAKEIELNSQVARQMAVGTLPEVNLPTARQYDFIDKANFDEAFGVSFLNDSIQDLLDTLRADLHSRYQTQIEEYEEKTRSQEAQLVQYRVQVEQLQEDNNRIGAERNQYKLERDDFEKRFIAAAEETKDVRAELEGQKMLVSEKQKHIDKLREDLHNAPAPQANPINVGSNLSTESLKLKLAEEKAKKPKIYEVRPLDHKQSRFAAIDENGKEIEFGYLDMGKYNPQEGPFRPTAAELDKAVDEAGVEPEQQFQVESPGVQPVKPIDMGMANGESRVQEEDALVTRAEVRAIVQEELAKAGIVKGSAA